MIELAQDIQRLMLYAKFEAVCAISPCKEAILNLCAQIRNADPNFFSDNEAFESWHEDDNLEFTDFDLMVAVLKNLHMTRLHVDDSSTAFYSVLSHYAIPELDGEARWGEAIDTILDVLANSFEFTVTMHSITDSSSAAPCTFSPDDIVDAEFAEVV
jgi:hypothetical protein